MNPYRLYHFSDESGETEFVVISDGRPADVRAEYASDTVTCSEVIDIDGDCTMFPCDRPLRRD